MSIKPTHKNLRKLQTEINSFAKRKKNGQKRLTMFRRNDGHEITEMHEFIFIKNLLIKNKVVHQRCGGCDLLTKI